MAGDGLGHEVVVARRVGEGAVAVAVVRVMKPLTMMMTRGGGHGGLVGQRGIHFVLLKEGENGIIIDWPINQTNHGGASGGTMAGNHKCALGHSGRLWKGQSPGRRLCRITNHCQFPCFSMT